MSDSTLEFTFDNVSDIDLPPTAGPNRQVRIDEAPIVEDVQRKDRKAGGAIVTKRMVRARLIICDGGLGIYPAEENGRIIFADFDMADPRNRTAVKRMFLSARIQVPDGAPFSQLAPQLVGKTIGIDFKHSNGKRDDGSPVVYGNVRDFNVPADMLTSPQVKKEAVPQVA